MMTRFRYGLPLLFLFLPFFFVRAQNASFTLLGFDVADYPLLRARFFVADAAGNPVRDLLVSDFRVRDNGADYIPSSLSCPAPAPPQRISSVLAVDISGSMVNGGNIDIARSAAAAWVGAMPLGYSECAITSFDHEGYLNSDFTVSRPLLLQRIAGLFPGSGGTDYNAGLIADPVGAVRIAAGGAHKRVVVFLTDGEGGGDEESIVREALANDVTVYVMVLRMRAPQALKNVAERTGGLWFENVESAEQGAALYRAILRLAQGEEPCELVWEVPADCVPLHDVEIDLPLYGAGWKGRYLLPDTVFPALSISPFGIAFGPLSSGSAKDSVVTVTARNRRVTIFGIESGSPFFSVRADAGDFPLTLDPGESYDLPIRFSPVDSAFQYGKIILESDACSGNTLGCTGGLPGIRSPETALRLTAPNGGEVFNAGEDVVIEWEGILPEDTVRLEYSIDGGDVWTTITDSATGLRHRWVAPPVPSDRCLMRVRQLTAGGERGVLTIPTPDRASAGDFSPDGRFVAVGELQVDVFDSYTGERVSRVADMARSVHSLQFSPDGAGLLVGSGDFSTYLYDWLAALPLRQYGSAGTTLSSSRFSPDGGRIASHSYDRDVVLYDAAGGNEIRRLRGHTLRGFAVAYSPDGGRIVSGGTDNVAIIWDAAGGAPLHRLDHANWVNSAFFSPDGTRVVTACSDRSVRVWDAATGALLLEIPQPVAAANAQFSPDGAQLCITRYGPEVEIRDARTGALVRRLIGHGRSVPFADWSDDGGRILTVSWDSTARVWDLARLPDQSDLSDRYWAIVLPQLSLQDVHMERTAVGKRRDSVAAGWLCNTGTAPVRVDSITFADGKFFSLVSGFPPFTLQPGDCVPAEFRFAPGRVGSLRDSVIVHTGAFATVATITGQGMLDPLRLAVESVDFGQVRTGEIKDTVITAVIRNAGMVPLGIRTDPAGPDAEQFTLLSGGGDFALDPGESRTMTFRFAPQRKGKTSGRIRVEYATITNSILGLPPADILLYGEGICPEELPEGRVMIPETLAAAPGERMDIPVIVEGAHDSISARPRRYRLLLRYNRSLLAPLDTAEPDILTEEERVLMYEGEWSGESDTLRILPVIAALGNAERTGIVIESFTWEDGCSGGLGTADGEFRLEGLCPEGGTRLFFAEDSLFLKPVAPNPARGPLRIEYGVIEQGTTELCVVDAAGRKAAVLVRSSLIPGRYLLDFNPEGLPAGSYRVMLVTPTQALSVPLIITE